jgi:hypothetical protein
MPAIVRQEVSVLFEGIKFQGQYPWLGILFWSTFATSALFYLFFVGIVLMRIAEAICRILTWLDKSLLQLRDRPVRAVTMAMILVETGGFVIWGVVK